MKTALNALALALTLTSVAGAQTPNAPGANPQRQTAEQSFKKRDADNDGFLSKTEIVGSHVADAFDKLDTNKDGKLSFAEYKAGRDAMQQQRGSGGPNGAAPSAARKPAI